MNMYLLDTHILLWWLSDDKKLTKKLRSLIENPDNHILVSSVSIWEIVIKKSLNKLKAPDNLKEILDTDDFEILPMTSDHALCVEHLPLIHHDPFDRLLIAQCIVDDLVFVTADKIIPKYKINCF
jgi:PIN domain nuclease of toxin-antitoxin system